MDRFTVTFAADTYLAICKAAAAEGVSQSKLVNRLVRQGLALDAPSDQAAIMLAMVRTAVKEELRPVRRIAYIAAREAAQAKFWARQTDAHQIAEIVPTHQAVMDALDLGDDEALKEAVQLLRRKEIERRDEQAVEAAEAAAAVLEVPADQAEPFLGGDDDLADLDASDCDTEEPDEMTSDAGDPGEA